MQKIKKIAISIAIIVIIIMAQSSVSFASSEKWNLREISIGNYDINVVHLAIVGVMGLQTLISIILAISLYKKSKELDEIYYEEGNNIVEQISREKKEQIDEEPVAVKKLKEESEEEHPKAVKEMEDKKKIEEIQKIAEEEEKNKVEAKEPEEVSQNTMNFKHQKALDDFYNYAEEIKQDVVEKKVKTKGKHSK